MRVLRNRFLWGAIGLLAGAWSIRAMQERREQSRLVAQRSRGLWRRSMESKPTMLHTAAKAGRAMMDTTMRTVRAMGRR